METGKTAAPELQWWQFQSSSMIDQGSQNDS
jgi:hypothetical protein